MKNSNSNIEEKLQIELSEIPLKSNLGLLAYGDIAFEAWREIKKKSIKANPNAKE
ncbi:hypothetical protein RM697_10290 [Ichthyenterobacterium sp. W332]|uniref:Uncharacterized protein n=1 Tax=Microcosmobacter mediterraneus TaxID=3075607 RepID=A0ABU2YLK4_9FLAO|nr:hypothetical protein [Ichthyenterobacterium sp. W332]MDT0559039.1 hypothetical protein [Ichthyenterobacterium sp. W332]